MADVSLGSSGSPSRRSFLKSTAAIGAAATLASFGTNFAHAAGSDTIKVGLVGCGGRGTGAAEDCAGPNEGVQIVALGDMFQERINSCREGAGNRLGAEKFKVKDDKCFTGFDAYQKVIASGV